MVRDSRVEYAMNGGHTFTYRTILLDHFKDLPTTMDYEDVGNVSNYTFENDVTPQSSRGIIVHEVVFALICLVAVVTDSFIIYINFRFKKMRTVPNILLANWAIADLCSLIFTPSAYRLVTTVIFIPMSYGLMCILIHVAATLHITTLWFAILVAIDWFTAAYFEKASKIIRRYHKLLLAIMWLSALLSGIVTSGLCVCHLYSFLHAYVLFFSYCAILLLVIGFQCFRGVQKCRSKFIDYPSLMLTLVTAFVISWFLGFLNFFMMSLTRIYHPMLAVIGVSNILCTSIVNFILLYYLNKDFRVCFLQTVRCSKSKDEEVDFDFANPVYNKATTRPIVRVTFHKNQDLLVS